MKDWVRENPEYVIILAILLAVVALVAFGIKEAGIAGITGILGFMRQKDKNDTVIEKAKAKYESEKEITDDGCEEEKAKVLKEIEGMSVDQLVALGNSIIQSRSGDTSDS